MSKTPEQSRETSAESSRRWAWINVAYSVTLVFLGISGLVAGGLVAVDKSQPELLLIVGAVLLILPALVRAVTEVRAKWRGIELVLDFAARRTAEAEEQLEELVTTDLPPETKEQIERITEGIETVKEYIEAAGQRSDPLMSLLGPPPRPKRRRRRQFESSTRYLPGGQVALRLEAAHKGTVFAPMLCRVTAPDGTTHEAYSVRARLIEPGGVEHWFPKDFLADSEVGPEGAYKVQWHDIQPATDGPPLITDPPLASDFFAWPPATILETLIEQGE